MKFSARYLLAIDPSLTCSGWAIFSVDKSRLLGVGKVKTLSPKIPLGERLLELHHRVEELLKGLDLNQNDVLICEGETSMKDPKGAIKVEQVRGIFEGVARNQGVLVPGRVNPRSVQSEIIGLKGAQQKREIVKESARRVALAMYAKELDRLGFDLSEKNLIKNQDIIDALLVGSLSLSKLRVAGISGSSIMEVFSDPKRQRRSSRYGWGKGEGNSFGWSEVEIKKLL